MDKPLKPPLAGNNQEAAFSTPKFLLYQDRLNQLALKLMEKKNEELGKFQLELHLRAKYLREKYPNGVAQQYAMFYVLTGTGINPENVISLDDFPVTPVNDSIESFVDDLVARYSK